MNGYLQATALLAVLCGIVHTVAGEIFFRRVLVRDELPPLMGSRAFTRQTLRFSWHLATVAWVGLAGALWLLTPRLSLEEASLLARIVAATFAVSAFLSFVVTRGRHFSWGLLLGVAVLAWLGD